MLKHQTHSYTVIDSDNCKMEYKSSSHFWSIQELCNKYPVPIIRVSSIVRHGNGKVDHVGGLAKTTI